MAPATRQKDDFLDTLIALLLGFLLGVFAASVVYFLVSARCIGFVIREIAKDPQAIEQIIKYRESCETAA